MRPFFTKPGPISVASNGDEPVLLESQMRNGCSSAAINVRQRAGPCAGFRGIFAPAWRTVVLTSPRLM